MERLAFRRIADCPASAVARHRVRHVTLLGRSRVSRVSGSRFVLTKIVRVQAQRAARCARVPYLFDGDTARPLPDDPPYLRGLNAPQREAVLTTEGPVLMLAGRARARRPAHRTAGAPALDAEGLSVEILSVTFTNKAAREMRERVGACRRRGRGDAVARHLPCDRREDAPPPRRTGRAAIEFHDPSIRRPARVIKQLIVAAISTRSAGRHEASPG